MGERDERLVHSESGGYFSVVVYILDLKGIAF
jgi:hypothetical protein